jgi:hypothetical protein
MTVYDIALKYAELDKKREYPSKPQKPQREAYPNNSEWGAALDYWELLVSRWRMEVKSYSAAGSEYVKQFKAELLQELGLDKHPKAEKLFEMAWDDGHSNGFLEVAICAAKLAELLY